MNSGGSDIAVVHGHFLASGGGEYVAAEIAQAFDAPLYYGFGEPKYEPDDVECIPLFEDRRFSNRIKNSPFFRNLFYMRNFQCVPELHDYDVLIQSGNEPGWYVPPDDQVVVKYTHSPPRDAYDGFPKLAQERGRLYHLSSFATRTLYQANLSYPDLYVANSGVIARRLDRYWDKRGDDVKVVYPPVDVESFGQEHSEGTSVDGEYYLVLDRLVERKHVGDIVETFARRPESKLIITGTGPKEEELREQAADVDYIQFLGYVSEAEKRSLLAGAKALLYAAEEEDFGIVPIEALASGTPVVAPREGFTQHQIQHGVTGLLYDRGPGKLDEAVDHFEMQGVAGSPSALEHVAEQFSRARFREEMREAVEFATQRARVEPKVERLGEADLDTDLESVIPTVSAEASEFDTNVDLQ